MFFFVSPALLFYFNVSFVLSSLSPSLISPKGQKDFTQIYSDFRSWSYAKFHDNNIPRKKIEYTNPDCNILLLWHAVIP